MTDNRYCENQNSELICANMKVKCPYTLENIDDCKDPKPIRPPVQEMSPVIPMPKVQKIKYARGPANNAYVYG